MPVIAWVNRQFLHLERERQLDDRRASEDHRRLSSEKHRTFTRRLQRGRRVKPNEDDPDVPLEVTQAAFEEDRQASRLAVVREHESANTDQPARIAVIRVRWRKRFRGDTNILAYESL